MDFIFLWVSFPFSLEQLFSFFPSCDIVQRLLVMSWRKLLIVGSFLSFICFLVPRWKHHCCCTGIHYWLLSLDIKALSKEAWIQEPVFPLLRLIDVLNSSEKGLVPVADKSWSSGTLVVLPLSYFLTCFLSFSSWWFSFLFFIFFTSLVASDLCDPVMSVLLSASLSLLLFLFWSFVLGLRARICLTN